MPTLETSAETADFLNELSPYLSHLPPEEHADLLEELAIHLESHLDVAEAAGDTRSLRRIVGSPESFVIDYCASAQIPLRAPEELGEVTVVGGPDHEGPISRLIQQVGVWVKAAEERLLGRDAWRSFVEFLPELAPAWWVARAVLLTMVLGQIFGGDGATHLGQIPIPKLFGSAVVGTVFAVWLASKSVALGRRQQGSGRVRLANVGVAVIAFFALGTVAFAVADPYYEGDIYYPANAEPVLEEHIVQGGSMYDGGVYGDDFYEANGLPVPTYGGGYDGHGPVVENLYPYGADGTLLTNVRLFDQAGRPFTLMMGEVDGWPLPVPNMYPRIMRVEGEGSIALEPAQSIEPLELAPFALGE